jgi:hypothetical protein
MENKALANEAAASTEEPTSVLAKEVLMIG